MSATNVLWHTFWRTQIYPSCDGIFR